MNEYLDLDGRPQFTAGRAGELPYAPDIPTPYNPQAPTQAPEMSLRDRIERALFMGGATDVRNMASAVAPAGLSMALARGANPTAQVAQRGAMDAYDAAEQMFDLRRAAPVMAAGGGGLLMAGGAAAGEQPKQPPTIDHGIQRSVTQDMATMSIQDFIKKHGTSDINEAMRRAQAQRGQRSWWEFWK
jgi:hypothetical protein